MAELNEKFGSSRNFSNILRGSRRVLPCSEPGQNLLPLGVVLGADWGQIQHILAVLVPLR